MCFYKNEEKLKLILFDWFIAKFANEKNKMNDQFINLFTNDPSFSFLKTSDLILRKINQFEYE